MRALKPFLIKVCKDDFCITLMLTALKKDFHRKSSPGDYFRLFVGLSCGIFLYFLRTVLFLMKICTYILDNTLMVVRLKNLWGYCPLLGAVLSFVRERDGGIFSIFLYFLRKVWYVSWSFAKIFLVLSGNHAKNKMACHLHFARLFWIMLGHIFSDYTVLLILRNPNIPLMFCTDFLVTKEKKKFLPLLW